MNILNKLTIKHLKMNKKRTIVTIIGILLSTALMLGIGLLFSTMQDNAIRTVKEDTGDYHVKIETLSSDKLDILKNNKNIDSYFLEKPIGFSVFEDSKLDYRKYFFIDSANDEYFKQIKLLKGRFPQNEKEIVISQQIERDTEKSYKIGDEISFAVGPRMIASIESYQNDYYDAELEEGIAVKEKKTYKIVGIIEKPVFEPYDAAGYTCLTKYQEKNSQDVAVYVKFKKPSKAYEDAEVLMKNLGLSEKEEPFSFNQALLSLYGASKYDNILSTLSNVLMIVLTLISIGCIVVIYNSFAISVMERKKQFGLFSSIGATKKQLRHTVFFEAFLVSIIGIPLGIISSFIGIGTVLAIINHLIPNLFGTRLVLTVYPIFFIIPIVFMLLTIFISAYLPAYKASKITPIEAIRLNDDIKIKNKKLKTGKWVRNLFGVEGEIALKNIKRNKKKYRITIASLFISIVLFVSFSTFVEYGLKTSEDTLSIPDYDIRVTLYNPTVYDYKTFIDQMRNYEGVEKSIAIKSGRKYSTSYQKDIYATDILNAGLLREENFLTLTLIALDQKSYDAYLKQLGLSKEQPILLNKIHYTVYRDNNRRSYHKSLLKDADKDYAFQLCDMKRSENPEDDTLECGISLEDVYVTDQVPFALEDDFLKNSYLNIIIPDRLFQQLFTKDSDDYIDDITVYLKAPKYQKIDQYITEYIDSLDNKSTVLYYNYPKDMKLVNNLYLVIAILLYGFISLVTLIGVTSVFNTINTSIALRRKEFAMLRSMGLTPRGFNKILYFESFFFGAKSLLYGIPFSFLIILWIHVSMMNVSSLGDIMIPWKSIGIAILGVFIIVFATMMYATKKMKRENILDAIREENI